MRPRARANPLYALADAIERLIVRGAVDAG
jgi:hypothetical protein